ncbi:MAG TPA: hypothetical protein VFS66_14700 [Acidimicrobiia bacterium]|nr:hypothetical protein [Acidimicrobiia bacterium]
MSHAREDDTLILGASDRIELIATIIMALAAIATAWCAFQATKWGGIMSIEFSNANAGRVESTRVDSLANTQRSVDVDVFTAWLDAVAEEIATGRIPPVSESGYEPVDGTLSAFYYERMRDEFRPALDAWLAAEPLNNPDAPKTPFEMEEYQLAAAEEADELLEQSAVDRQDALDANQNGDNYVLTTVGFALVIFFAGVSSKLVERRNRWIALGVGLFLFIGGVIAVVLLPVVRPF